jgi:hypothetical protein
MQRLQTIVGRVERRKNAPMQRVIRGDAEVHLLVAVFRKLRRLFPANYLCLYDSLVLVEFLARYDIFPAWVFGVRLEPWAAHCWVQQGTVVFNEGIEEADDYVPIMVI